MTVRVYCNYCDSEIKHEDEHYELNKFNIHEVHRMADICGRCGGQFLMHLETQKR
jgi:hypothetical protein